MGEKSRLELQPAPSKEAVVKFLRNEPGSFRSVLFTLAGRTALIATGIAVLGEKDRLLKNSFAAALTIELFLFWHYSRQLEKKP